MLSAGGNCTNVASGSPTGLLDVEGYCGDGTNLGFRLHNGQLQSNLHEPGGVASWTHCANVRSSDHWVQMGKCSDKSTAWTHDPITGQLSTTVHTHSVGVGPDNSTKLCLDWKDHVLRPQESTNVWGRALSGSAHALVFLNVASNARTVQCDSACFRSLGYDVSSQVLEARDLWARKPLPDFTVAQGLAAKDLPPNGGVAMFKVWPKKKNE